MRVCLCVNACMFVCLNVSVYVCVNVRDYACANVWIRQSVNVLLCLCASILVCSTKLSKALPPSKFYHFSVENAPESRHFSRLQNSSSSDGFIWALVQIARCVYVSRTRGKAYDFSVISQAVDWKMIFGKVWWERECLCHNRSCDISICLYSELSPKIITFVLQYTCNTYTKHSICYLFGWPWNLGNFKANTPDKSVNVRALAWAWLI